MTEQSTITPEETTEVPTEEQAPAFSVHDLPGGLSAALEAVLMVVDEPVAEVTLASALEVPVDDVVSTLEQLEAEYAAADRGFTLRSVAGGWRVYSRAELAPVVEKFLLDGQQAKLTQAALETLAVIAYRQPVSRARVSAVRGVNVDGVVRTCSAAASSPRSTSSARAARCSTARRRTSSSGWGWPRSTTCPPSRPSCPRSTPSTSSPSRGGHEPPAAPRWRRR